MLPAWIGPLPNVTSVRAELPDPATTKDATANNSCVDVDMLVENSPPLPATGLVNSKI
jgi:hypothetical protein